MPDESTVKDRKTAVPAMCRRCDKPFWHDVERWPPPAFCPMCEDLAAASEMTFAQAMDELFDA